MSAGLTIEQVLARSLRMPRRRLAAQSAIARTMDRAEAAHQQQQQQLDGTVNPAAVQLVDGSTPDGASLAGTTAPSATTSSTTNPEKSYVHPLLRHQQQPVSLPSETGISSKRFNVPIPKEDPDPYPDRPMLRRLPHQGLARNCDDLLTHLVACKQLGDWKDALSVFAAHPKAMSVGRPHINALVETLVGADKASVVETMVSTNQFTSDAQADMAIRCTVSALNRRDNWKEALHVLSSMRQKPPPIDAYNEIVNACEPVGAWREAMKIVFDLKDRHDQYVTELSSFERARDEAAVAAKVAAESNGSGEDTVNISSSSPTPSASDEAPKQLSPKPDAVTWTTLITILEKCGKDDLAQEVLKVVPPAERETILASYAALIYTWSQQRKRKF